MTEHILHIGEADGAGFHLPAAIVTMTTAILGIRGSGKTNTAVVAVEEILDLGYQVIIIDPVDVWWGLKSSKSGDEEGYPIVVLGGQHGDLPLTHENGRGLADFAVEERVPMILSLRHLRKGKQKIFVTDFCEQLYHRKGEPEYRTPTLVVIDEASKFIPQRVGKAEARMVGATEDIVRSGRSAGLGMMVIDQRAASVNKDVLTQLEILVAHRHTSPQDRNALKDWVRQHDTGGMEKQFLDALASLRLGQAYFWSPMLDLFEDVQVRERHTYDSSKTPELGDELPLPDRMASVDLGALENRLAESIEEAKANDPKELKKRIAELEKELEAAPAAEPDHNFAELLTENSLMQSQIEVLEEKVDDVKESIAAAGASIRMAITELDSAHSFLTSALNGQAEEADTSPDKKQPEPVAPSRPEKPAKRTEPRTSASTDVKLKGRQVDILEALAGLCGLGVFQVNRTRLAQRVGLSSSSGGYAGYLSDLKRKGLIDYPSDGDVAITADGIDLVGEPPEPQTMEEIRSMWREKLNDTQWRIIEELIRRYPMEVSRVELAAMVGLSPTSGGYAGYLSELNSFGLISYPSSGHVKVSPEIVEEN